MVLVVGVRADLSANAVHFFHPVVGCHIVDVITAVEVVKALVCRQIFAIVTKIPLANARGCISKLVKGFCNGDFITKYAVHVVEELIGVEEVCR